jgi:glycosyltransferase involved in cell wall biosynthesis
MSGAHDLKLQQQDFSQPKTALISVIVTHFNYVEMISTALNSVLEQTYQKFECIIVDDCSNIDQRAQLRQKIAELADERFKLVELPNNLGQTNAIFEGLRQSSGEFVALLDPDDVYAPQFLEKMLHCHLNPCVYAAVASCEMGLFRVGGAKLTSTYTRFKYDAFLDGTLPKKEVQYLDFGFSAYYTPDTTGWLWCTTSSMMFRRDALLCLQRESYMPDIKICGDTYCVLGAHMLGGSLFVDEVLSWRGIHEANSVENSRIVSSRQRRHKNTFEDLSEDIRFFAAKTLVENGSFRTLPNTVLVNTLRANFQRHQLKELVALDDELSQILDLVA